MSDIDTTQSPSSVFYGYFFQNIHGETKKIGNFFFFEL